MNLRLISTAALAGALVLGGAAQCLAGQTLATVAREEAARRKTIKTPARVITNDDLKAVQAPSVSEGSGSAATGAPGATEAPAASEAAPSPSAPADSGTVKDQAYWAKRISDLHAKLDHDQTLAAALQSQINALTADFTSHDDPIQRAQIAENRQKALDEYNRLQKGVADDQKAIADLLEEARRAGVPPGWLRT